MKDEYIRSAKVLRVIDGDTIVVDIDLGFGIWKRKQRLRILGVDCPEMTGATREAGKTAKAFTEMMLDGQDVTVKTYVHDTDSFGRVLADVEVDGVDMGTELLRSNHAVPKNS